MPVLSLPVSIKISYLLLIFTVSMLDDIVEDPYFLTRFFKKIGFLTAAEFITTLSTCGTRSYHSGNPIGMVDSKCAHGLEEGFLYALDA